MISRRSAGLNQGRLTARKGLTVRKLAVHVFDYSLDGIIGVEDTPFFDFCRELPDDDGLEAWRQDKLKNADLHIMGRNTYQGMSQFFPTAGDDHPYAEIMNNGQKAVFSSTLTSADWNNCTIVSGKDTAAEIEKLKQQGSGDIVAHGGVSFVQSLARLDLADEYVLTVFPYVAGMGATLFGPATAARPLELISSSGFDNGMVGLVYRRLR
jgi:dihydrofolate reductase